MTGVGDVPRIAINGFGRIGRLVTRVLLEGPHEVDFVAINDLTERNVLTHLFRHDSVHGSFEGTAELDRGDLVLNGDRLETLAHADPADLPWSDLDVDLVIEASGRFVDRAGVEKHVAAGAPQVLLTAPGTAMDVTIVRGVNDADYQPNTHKLVSAASCTTNCVAPLLKVLQDRFGVQRAMVNTVHAATNDQGIVDQGHSDLRRARSSLMSLIPTKTGAARAVGQVIPELAGKLEGLAVRVPLSDVSLSDVTAELAEDADEDLIVEAFCQAEQQDMAGILGVEQEPLVSVDFTHDARSCIVDLQTLLCNGTMVKALAWYDNEWGYANRCAELALRMTGVTD